jgi:tyrosinase
MPLLVFLRTDAFQYDLAKSTSRHPSTFNTRSKDFASAWVNGNNPDWDIITGELRGSEAIDSNTLPEAVYRLFLEEYLPTYNAFATDGFVPGQGVTHYSSLEDIHGQLHVWTGGAGQMSSVPVAAFDPIFWFVQPLLRH